MARYKPTIPFSVPLILLKPTYTSAYGVTTKQMPSVDKGELFFGCARAFGGNVKSGNERDTNGIYTIESSLKVETYYRPDITSDCQVAFAESGEVYEILGEPENVEMRNQYMIFRVRKIKGGA